MIDIFEYLKIRFISNCAVSVTYVYSLQPMEVYVDNEAKLTLHGLQQHYVKIQEKEKNRKLFELLDALEFNQVCFNCCICLIRFSTKLFNDSYNLG